MHGQVGNTLNGSKWGGERIFLIEHLLFILFHVNLFYAGILLNKHTVEAWRVETKNAKASLKVMETMGSVVGCSINRWDLEEEHKNNNPFQIMESE